MRAILSCAEMRKLEQSAFDMGLSGLVLMENAATAAAKQIQAHVPRSVLVFAGKGNNAGDGFAVARRLFVAGISVEILLTSDPTAFKPDAALNFSLAEKMGIPMIKWENFDRTRKADLLVDALLGTGLHGAVSGAEKEAILWINQSGIKVLAIDIPSGIDGDTGVVHGVAVHADETITFGYPKLGLYSPLSADYVGQIYTDDISLLPPQDAKRFLIEKEDVFLPMLSRAAHKGTAGRAVIVGGSPGMAGAVYMATRAAELCGAGLVTAVVPPKLMPVMMKKLCGAMCSETIPKADALLVGNGMGRGKEGRETLLAALETDAKTIIIDADGLYHLCPADRERTNAELILTPHMGEMARLTGQTVPYLTENRVTAAEALATAYHATVILKGASTVVATPTGQTYINTTGNPGMAKGGSGDILAGMLCGLSAAGVLEAAKIGVFLHGLAGDLAKEAISERAMCADTLLNFISAAIKCMEQENNVQNRSVAEPPSGRKYI